MTLDVVYLLWDIYVVENDTCFKFFIGLAMLLENKNSIIGSEVSVIPQTIANLTIQNATQMKQIYRRYHTKLLYTDRLTRAIDLRLRTPASFLGKLRELEIFKKGNDQVIPKLIINRLCW